MKKAVTFRDGIVRVGCLATVAAAVLVVPASGANLVARWKLNEAGPVYADSGPNNVPLVQDSATTSAISSAGIIGASAQLNWQPTPGIATRLAATNAALQTDSFGFSFWFNPSFLNDWDNLLAKEMAFDNSVPGFARVAWQLHLLGNNGSGAAPLELVVRGDRRTQGDFFGAVTSATNLPLQTSSAEWIHVAGGYDAVTGALRLYVNGVEAVANNSSPGAHHSDGSALSVGTARNGADFVAFAGGVFIEDVQIYDGPPSASEVAFLRANPGQAIRSFVITSFAPSANGDVSATFSTVPGANYTVEVASSLGGFAATTNFTAQSDFTPVALSKAAIDGVLGPAPRTKLFVRALEQFVPTGFPTCD